MRLNHIFGVLLVVQLHIFSLKGEIALDLA
jgi:hypothetical protein